MPTLNDIEQEIARLRAAAQDEIRRKYLKQLADHTGRDTIMYASAFTSYKTPHIPAYPLLVTLEDMQGFMSAIHGLKSDKLDLILHSPGGSMEAAEQIVQYLRAKYKHIRAFVPQNAMSAATMVACAADVIVMGKHSCLGPIDPQVEFPTPSGKFVAPAQAILDEFEQAKREIATNPSTAPIWLTKVQAYPPGFLQMCRNTLDLARDKVATWLDNYMFGSQEKDRPGKRIAEWLGDANQHKTHGRPIDLKQARDIGLRVKELEADQELQERVLSAFHATMVTFKDTQCVKLVENHQGRGVYTQGSAKGHSGVAVVDAPPNFRMRPAGGGRLAELGERGTSTFLLPTSRPHPGGHPQ